MSLPGIYLTLSIFSAVGVITALVPARRISHASIIWFFMAWLTGELAAVHLCLQLLLTVVAALLGVLDTSYGETGLLIFLLSWLGLIQLHRQSMDAGGVLSTALRSALGDNYRGDIPQQRQGVLREAIESAEWMHPFKMTRPGVKVHRDIAYGDVGKRNHLDVYEPLEPREGGFPVLLQVHGGGWMIGEKQQQALPLMYHLAQRGWLCVACNYRLSPKDAFPAHIIDVKKALAWVREHAAEYGGNPEFLAITGGSAGGHLSSLAALTPNKADWQPGFEEVDTSVSAAVPFYGVYDFLDRDNIRGNMSMQDILADKVLQCQPEENEQLWQDACPLNHVNADAPPMFVIQGTHDSLVWVEEARTFVAAAQSASDQVVAYGELPGAQHAFEVFHSVRTDLTVNAVTDFLEWCYARREGVR
jgi:acetyl esterase/lipase